MGNIHWPHQVAVSGKWVHDIILQQSIPITYILHEVLAYKTFCWIWRWKNGKFCPKIPFFLVFYSSCGTKFVLIKLVFVLCSLWTKQFRNFTSNNYRKLLPTFWSTCLLSHVVIHGFYWGLFFSHHFFSLLVSLITKIS